MSARQAIRSQATRALAAVALAQGDKLEIVHFVGGGQDDAQHDAGN